MPYLEDIHADYAEACVKIIAINAKEDGGEDPKAYAVPGLMIVGGDGVVAWRRAWTDLPAGRQVAEFGASQVREQLDALLGSRP